MNMDEQAIRRLVAQWHSATAAGDVETVLGLMAEDVVFLVPGQLPMKGRSTFANGLRRLLTSHRLESTSDIQEVYVSGDLGYCWSVLNVRITPLSDSNAVVRKGSAWSILRKQANGEWVVVCDANMLSVASLRPTPQSSGYTLSPLSPLFERTLSFLFDTHTFFSFVYTDNL